jgi:hypothetical protein
MKKHLITAFQVIVVVGFVGLGIANIVKTNHQVKFKDIQLKSKQSDLIQLENKFDLLNKELEEKNIDAEKAKQLETEKIELQKQLEQAQKDLQAKAKAKADQQAKLAQAVPKLSQKAYASSGSCADEITKYDWNHNTALAVARAESGLNPGALNDNPRTGDYSVGCFQINLYGANARNRPSEATLRVASENVAYAYKIYVGNGRSFKGQWGVCRNIACY